jgi:hypothetical protein
MAFSLFRRADPDPLYRAAISSSLGRGVVCRPVLLFTAAMPRESA